MDWKAVNAYVGLGNVKLGRRVLTLSREPVRTCPPWCFFRPDRPKLDGVPRCYAWRSMIRRPSVRAAWTGTHPWEEVEARAAELARKASCFRVLVAGDFGATDPDKLGQYDPEILHAVTRLVERIGLPAWCYTKFWGGSGVSDEARALAESVGLRVFGSVSGWGQARQLEARGWRVARTGPLDAARAPVVDLCDAQASHGAITCESCPRPCYGAAARKAVYFAHH
jgi:hypothetical protein